MDLNVLKFIDWVEGNYTPINDEEEVELYAFGERVYPFLMELRYSK